MRERVPGVSCNTQRLSGKHTNEGSERMAARMLSKQAGDDAGARIHQPLPCFSLSESGERVSEANLSLQSGDRVSEKSHILRLSSPGNEGLVASRQMIIAPLASLIDMSREKTALLHKCTFYSRDSCTFHACCLDFSLLKEVVMRSSCHRKCIT